MGEEARTTTTQMARTQHFVLVHGIGHGAWCWYKIKALLQRAGHRVSCLDLSGAGIDLSRADEILTFDHYDQPFFDFISALPEEEKVVLVGHSAGGLSVTRASHEFANKIRLAIYICATMLRSGFRSEEDLKDGVPDLSDFGDVYELGFGLGPDKPPTSAIIRKEFHPKILYQLSPPEDSILGSFLLRPGPVMALQSARFDGGDGADKVNRVYIRTTQDHIIKPAQQDAMIKRWPPREVFTIESDHCPFFSNPDQLFQLLTKALLSICPDP